MRSCLPFVASLLVLSFSAAATEDAPRMVSDVRKLAGEFRFTEGPAWNPKEQALYFSDIPKKALHRWSESDGVKLVRKGEQATNGLYFDSRGVLFACEIGACRAIRMEGDRETTVADAVEGRKLGHTNDIWVAPGGGVYFTVPKPRNSPLADSGVLMGTIIYAPPGGGQARDVGKAIGIQRPNGVVGSADGKRLYYTDSGKCWVAQIEPDASLSDKQVAADQGSDGLTLDEHGNLYITAKEGVAVYSPAAKRIALIPVPESPANMTFGGNDGRTLFITARTGLYAVDLDVHGDGFASGQPRSE